MDQPSGPNEKPFEKSEERVIRGAEAIAEFIFGDRSHRRKVYYLAECSKIPIHRPRKHASACDRRRTKAGSKVRNTEDRVSGAIRNPKGSRCHECEARRIDWGSRAGEGAAPSSISERCENFHKARLTPSVSASTARRSQVELSQKRIEPRRRAFFQRACLVRR